MGNVIWVDENDNILGEVSKEKAHAEGILHRVAVTYVVNDKNEILVQERMDMAKLDHSSAGHVDVGESYLQAAERELYEELGIISTELQEVGSVPAIDGGANFSAKHFMKVFVIKAIPGELQADEVKSVFWAKPEDVLLDMQVNPNKYTNGFKATLKIFLENSSKSFR